jgi:hypothetical protein
MGERASPQREGKRVEGAKRRKGGRGKGRQIVHFYKSLKPTLNGLLKFKINKGRRKENWLVVNRIFREPSPHLLFSFHRHLVFY